MRRGFNLFLLAAVLISQCGYGSGRTERSFEKNEEGINYLNQGRYGEAVEAFEKARQLNPKDQTIGENLAIAYNQHAVQFMQNDRYREAREYLKKALALKPDDNQIEENLRLAAKKAGGLPGGGTEPRAASGFFRGSAALGEDARISNDFLINGIRSYERKEYDLAMEMLTQAVEYSDKNDAAYELMGDIVYLQQELKQAKEYYLKAYRLRASKNLQEKIEKLEKESGVEGKMQQYEDEHFIIRYKRDLNQLFGGGYEIREYLREAWSGISKGYGVYPRNRVVVLLYDKEEYDAISQSPEWAAAHFDGKIRLPVYNNNMGLEQVKRIIWHELTHFFVYYLADGNCPSWLNEGLAQVEESRIARPDLSFFDAALARDGLYSLETLRQGIGEQAGIEEVTLFYQQSYVTALYIMDKHRRYKVKLALEEFGKGKTDEEVWPHAFGAGLEDFESGWREWIKEIYAQA